MKKVIVVVLMVLFSFKNTYSQKVLDLSNNTLYMQSKGKILYAPKLIISDSLLKEFLIGKINYPKFAKRKFIEYETDIDILVDITGKLIDSKISINEDEACTKIPLFDTNALNLLNTLKDKWIPGEDPSIYYSIPIKYFIKYNYNKRIANYYISIYNNKYQILIDSTTTVPPLLYDSIAKQLRSNSMEGTMTSYASSVGSNGTTRLGFEVDTFGKIGEIKIIHSASISLDKQALIEFKTSRTDHCKWFPATEDGIPISSYVEFDIYFDEYSTRDVTRSNIVRKNANASYHNGVYAFENEKYTSALKRFLEAKNYFLDNIELLFKIALAEIKLEKYDDACKDLEEIKRVAIDKPFPACVSEAKVDELIKLVCPKTEE